MEGLVYGARAREVGFEQADGAHGAARQNGHGKLAGPQVGCAHERHVGAEGLGVEAQIARGERLADRGGDAAHGLGIAEALP